MLSLLDSEESPQVSNASPYGTARQCGGDNGTCMQNLGAQE